MGTHRLVLLGVGRSGARVVRREEGTVSLLEMDWLCPHESSEVIPEVVSQRSQCLGAYREQPDRIEEDYRNERTVADRAYRDRQLFELVQNAADAIAEGGHEGRVHLVLRQDALYCANEGAPLDRDGVKAILFSRMSRKKPNRIGRFGIGFKSVLALTNRAFFFSRSGSVLFDEARSTELIRACQPSAALIPTLRIGFELDPLVEQSQDPALAYLMEWATTVVKLPLDAGAVARVSEQIQLFPAEFLLFVPHVQQLEFDDVVNKRLRTIRSISSGDSRFELADGDRVVPWLAKVATCHPPAPIALGEHELHGVPVSWAVPLSEGTRSRGRFWCFFPTSDESTLRGVLNAGWRTTSDRQALLERDSLNDFIVDQLVALVIEALPELSEAADPARFLDYLPARDAMNWADRQLSDTLYSRLAKEPSLPDGHGNLCRAEDTRLHPVEIPHATLETWLACPDRPRGYVHPSVVQRERRARAQRLGVQPAPSLAEWLTDLASAGTAAASGAAIAIAAVLISERDGVLVNSVRASRIVLTAEGDLKAPDPQGVFLSVSEGLRDERFHLVHPDLGGDRAVVAALKKLGITDLNEDEALRLQAPPTEEWRLGTFNWANWWGAFRRASEPRRASTLRELWQSQRLRARTLDGSFSCVHQLFLPSDVVPGDGSRDKGFVLDVVYHSGEMALLRENGLTGGPRRIESEGADAFLHDYVCECRRDFRKRAAEEHPRTPQEGSIRAKSTPCWGPLRPLRELSEAGRAALCELMLPLAASDVAIEVTASTSGYYYGSRRYPPASQLAVVNHGYLNSSLGLRRVQNCVGAELAEFRNVLPVTQFLSSAYPFLRLPGTPQDLSGEHWRSAFALALDLDDAGFLGRLYSVAADVGAPQPRLLRCRKGASYVNASPDSARVTADDQAWLSLLVAGEPAILAASEEAVRQLVERWGLLSGGVATQVFRVEAVEPEPGTPVLEVFPEWAEALPSELAFTELVPCRELFTLSQSSEGSSLRARDSWLDGKSFYYPRDLSLDVLRQRLAERLSLDLSCLPPEPFAGAVLGGDAADRAALACETPDLGSKLGVLLDQQVLSRHVPHALLMAARKDRHALAASDIGNLVLAVHGASTLQELAHDLRQAGFPAPSRWAGCPSATQFVASLDFPEEFAGRHRAERLPWEELDGPVTLPPLHPFQVMIAERMLATLRSPTPSRGVVSLPTGAGKTRVAVESLVHWIREWETPGCVLWIADRDELCEQAIRAWSEVWLWAGPARRLRVSRLWGSTNSSVVDAASSVHVVVTTYQTLNRRLGPKFDWLSRCRCIVVDEAHGATAPSYTQILNWAGISPGSTACPLIGLTATPFRGTEEETSWLARRFDQVRFDHGVFRDDDPYQDLQRQQVLSEVDHEILPGSTIELSDDELQQLQRFRHLPSSAEGRLGAEGPRNRALVEHICQQDGDWPIIVFATSVSHAEVLAGLLCLRGIPARAVSGLTKDWSRRCSEEAFRQGRIRVLTNYGVLTTGFDAPKVRALYVARPVYSPVLYQQMIGRGLRGPKNGGTDRCMIVNVEDNVQEYGEQLAFRKFEYLWQRTNSSRLG